MSQRERMTNQYLMWLKDIVLSGNYAPDRAYHKLLERMYDTGYIWLLGMDANRASHGMDMRYRFADCNGYSMPEASSQLDDRDCSVLEMVIALAIDCEAIMHDDSYGDRTAYWFWRMCDSLGVDVYDDIHMNYDEVDTILGRFNGLEYTSEGRGGLFYIPGYRHDMRGLETWNQMHEWLKKYYI